MRTSVCQGIRAAVHSFLCSAVPAADPPNSSSMWLHLLPFRTLLPSVLRTQNPPNQAPTFVDADSVLHFVKPFGDFCQHCPGLMTIERSFKGLWRTAKVAIAQVPTHHEQPHVPHMDLPSESPNHRQGPWSSSCSAPASGPAPSSSHVLILWSGKIDNCGSRLPSAVSSTKLQISSPRTRSVAVSLGQPEVLSCRGLSFHHWDVHSGPEPQRSRTRSGILRPGQRRPRDVCHAGSGAQPHGSQKRFEELRVHSDSKAKAPAESHTLDLITDKQTNTPPGTQASPGTGRVAGRTTSRRLLPFRVEAHRLPPPLSTTPSPKCRSRVFLWLSLRWPVNWTTLWGLKKKKTR